MKLIIDHDRVCPICGAFLDANDVCANGHHVTKPVSIESFKKLKLKIGDPDHIRAVENYERSTGYDRHERSRKVRIKPYKVKYKALFHDEIDASIVIKSTENNVRKAAKKKLERLHEDASEIIIEIITESDDK